MRGDEDLEGMRRDVRAFLADGERSGAWTPTCNSWMDGYDRAFSRAVAEQGWIGMAWPSRYGGGGRSVGARHAVTEELVAAGAPIAAHWFADRQVGPQLMRFGTDAQRARFLPAIARGECCFSVGMSEPEAGSDLAAIRTSATRVPGGWRVRGRKQWTSHAHLNELMVTLCRSEPRSDDRHAGLSQLIVALDADGVEVRPVVGMDGSAHLTEVLLDDVFVPHDGLLGQPGDGWHQVTAELAFERSGPERFLSVMPLLRAGVEAAGPDLADTDAEHIGRAVASLMALRQLVLTTVDAIARGEPADVRAALVKDLGTRFEQELVETLRFTAPADPAAAATFRRLLVEAQLAAPTFTLRGGASEILRGIVGRTLVPT